jgi:DNA polymerase-3 subunit delta'
MLLLPSSKSVSVWHMANDPEPTLAPRANPDLIGHANAEAVLRQAFESDRLAHAWMITGPRGIGKATLAYRFARFVFTGGGAQGDLMAFAGGGAGDGLYVDPNDPVFHRVAAEGHADLLTIERRSDPKSKSDKIRTSIVVDDARRLRDFLSLTPAEGGWRIAIIDAADEMNVNAANAVLKLVEEPPARALLLLVCHVPGRVLPTLRSRCRRLALSPLDDGAVADYLVGAAPDLDAAQRQVLAGIADGSPGRALALANLGGGDLHDEIMRMLAAAPGIDPRTLHSFADRMARRGSEATFSTAMSLLAGWIARLVAAGARGQLPNHETETARRFLAARGLEQWVELWEKITDLVARADRVNLDRKQVVLSIFAALEATARG